MISFLALCLLIGVSTARVVPELPSADLPLVEGRISNGQKARPGQFPYICGLSINRPKGTFWCGGTLLSDRWILTAAHCLYNASNVTAVLGTHNIRNQVGQLRIHIPKSHLIVHKGYNNASTENDIALIHLPEPVQLTKRIQPASLPRFSDVNNTYEGERVVAAGWGRVGDSRPGVHPVLQYIEAKVMNNKKCSRFYLGGVTKDNICISTKGRTSTCKGDSGGPLIYQDGKSDYVVGITSFGFIFGCELQIPTVFTRVTAYLPWIQEHTALVQL